MQLLVDYETGTYPPAVQRMKEDRGRFGDLKHREEKTLSPVLSQGEREGVGVDTGNHRIDLFD